MKAFIEMECTCVVFVANEAYLDKFIETCRQLIEYGRYRGAICLIVGDDLKDKAQMHPFIIRHCVYVKYFPDIVFPSSFYKVQNELQSTDGRNLMKKFQWHKLHLFNSFFKNWDYVFYMDCGMNIYRPIQPMIDVRKKGALLAHSDAYPTYEWKLGGQYEKTHPLYQELCKKYDLDIDYFQTGIMLYDTKIIRDDTFQELYNLAVQYPISRTNEQAIMALYFTTIYKVWEQIPLRSATENVLFYDYWARNMNETNYTITKVKNW